MGTLCRFCRINFELIVGVSWPPPTHQVVFMLDTQRMRFPMDVILVCIRGYAAYPLSYRPLEEMMAERGIEVDPSSISRWAIRFLPRLEKMFRKHARPAGVSWRMNETYIKVNGQWKYLYRAVDKAGETIDFLLTAKRDKKAAMRFFEKAIQAHGIPRERHDGQEWCQYISHGSGHREHGHCG